MAKVPGPAYGIRTLLHIPFEDALAQTREALKKEGFGVLTEIDVRETMKQKLGIDGPSYRILGACNPRLAHRAFQEEPEIGILLPCNVVVFEREDGVVVSAMNPEVAMGVVRNDNLREVASEAQARLQCAIAALDGEFGGRRDA